MFLLIWPMAVFSPVRTTIAFPFPLVTVVPCKITERIQIKSAPERIAMSGNWGAYREDHVVLVLDGDPGGRDGLGLLVLAVALSSQNGLIHRDRGGFDGNQAAISGDLVSNFLWLLLIKENAGEQLGKREEIQKASSGSPAISMTSPGTSSMA